MNQQSDTVDFIGGYKPVELKIIVKPIQEEFETLFRAEFNVEQNKKFLNHISVNQSFLKMYLVILNILLIYLYFLDVF